MSMEETIRNAGAAAAAFRELDQARTDRITRNVYLAAMDHRVRLAKLAAEETGVGVWQHKVIKNVIASQLVYEHIREKRTAGVISEDDRSGIVELARPLGPILGLVPTINPTSTAIFKILISMKTRNPIILSPSPAAKNSAGETARICYEAALAAGAPRHCVQWIAKPNPLRTKELMSHPGLALILATGSGELVEAAYRSGTPTLGVGPGNVPVYIGGAADIPAAVRNVLTSKTFDNGSVCASEQAVVVEKEAAEAVAAEFARQKAHFLDPPQIEKVGRVAYDPRRRTMSPAVVGQPVRKIAEMAGIRVPPDASVLIARLERVGPDEPLSAEILAPILAFYAEEDFSRALGRCAEIVRFGGLGHTAVIHSDSPEKIESFSRELNVARILLNQPSTHGALGGTYSGLPPSFTLGCGTGARNSTTDNVSIGNLIEIHRICRPRPNGRWMNFDPARYLDGSAGAEEIEKEFRAAARPVTG